MAHVPTPPARGTVDDSLRLGSGLAAGERDVAVRRLERLARRLVTFRRDSVDLDLSVKERGTRSQRTVLECWIGGMTRFVATSTRQPLEAALVEVREDLIRQVDDAKTRTEPRNNRQLRRARRRQRDEPGAGAEE